MSARSKLSLLCISSLYLLSACDTLVGAPAAAAVSGAVCPEFGSGAAIGGSYSGKVGLDAEIGAFLQASVEIRQTAVKMQTEVAKACVQIGRDIGVESGRLAGTAEDPVSGPCGAVLAKLDGTLSGSAKLKVEAQPPECTVDAKLAASCEAGCQVEVDPGRIVAECEPAQLSGHCEGTCSGQCEGKCEGECSGECSAKNAQGQCVGECKGECHGSCDATCHAHCEGSWRAPKCETEIEAPSVSGDCQANCEAAADFKAQCTPGALSVEATVEAEKLAALTASLKANLPALLVAQHRLGTQLIGEMNAVIKAGRALEGRLEGAGNKAVACVGVALNALVEASVKIDVTFKASASVGAKVGASAGS